MQIYKRRIFEANEEQKARRFGYRVKGTCKYTQSLNEAGQVRGVYVVEYIPNEKPQKNN